MLLIPGSSADHPEKRWPLDRFAEIATWMADAKITPVIIGTKAEGDIGTQIMKLEPRAKSVVGRTDLFQLATLAERALMAIGGDTGPMHLAAAARTPGVCLFAQEWTPEMAGTLHTVWNPQTRLGRAAPRGGPMMILHAATLESLSADDVKLAAIGMGVLPANMIRPEPKTDPEPEPAEIPPLPPVSDSGPGLAPGQDS
jgi:ADP-heptose:LPS heptosyltransferase